MVEIRSHTALRGVAAMVVLIAHYFILVQPSFAGSQPQLNRAPHVAVDFFFMLSGFILFKVYGAGFTRAPDAGHLRAFYLRRFIRIWPLHAVTLAFMVAFAIYQGQDGGLRDIVLNLLLIDAWGLSDTFVYNVPSWSISCEAAAYLLFPFAAHLASRRGGSAGLVVFSLAIYAVLIAVGAGRLDQPDGIPERLVILRILAGFPLGMALAARSDLFDDVPEAGLSLLQIASLVVVIVVVGLKWPDVLVIPAFAALMLATTADRGVIGRLARGAALHRAGEISYGIYMIHWPVIMCLFPLRYWLTGDSSSTALEVIYLVAMLVIVWGLSVLSYTRFEMPLRAAVQTGQGRRA